MTFTNPMGSPNSKPHLPTDPQSVAFIRDKLTELLVDQTGIAKAIVVETDPITGQQAFNFHYTKSVKLPKHLMERDIRGIPVRFTQVDD